MKKNFGIIAHHTRRPVDRRRVKARRLFLKQEYLKHNPERRVSMTDRRMLVDRRKLFSVVNKTFWEKLFYVSTLCVVTSILFLLSQLYKFT